MESLVIEICKTNRTNFFSGFIVNLNTIKIFYYEHKLSVTKMEILGVSETSKIYPLSAQCRHREIGHPVEQN